MIGRGRFQSVILLLLYDEVEVGTIKIIFRNRPVKPGDSITRTGANNTQAYIQQPKVTFLNDTASISETSDKTKFIQARDEGELRVLANLTGSTIAPCGVFLLVIGVITGAAKSQNNERLNGFVSPRTIQPVEITLVNPKPPRPTPPFFEAHCLIETMAMVLDFMIEHGVFREVVLVLKVSGVNVASGFMGTVDAVAGTFQSNLNVSVS